MTCDKPGCGMPMAEEVTHFNGASILWRHCPNGHDGYDIHHLCGHPSCIETSHLALLHHSAHMRLHALTKDRTHIGKFHGVGVKTEIVSPNESKTISGLIGSPFVSGDQYPSALRSGTTE